MEKRCFKCGLTKPLSEFSIHKYMRDGHLNKCKECVCIYSLEHRRKNIDKYREYDRARAKDPARLEKTRNITQRYREENPQRRAAQLALGDAVKRGVVVPMPCFVCGEKAEAHHPNYDAPLDVVWLCPPHHKQAHALVKHIEKGRI